MTTSLDWIQQRQPTLPAQRVDFAQRLNAGVDVPGEERTIALCGVGAPESWGEWTLYLMRETFLLQPDLGLPPADITAIDAQVGTYSQRTSMFSIPLVNNGQMSLGGCWRGYCIHVSAGALDLTVRYIPQTRTIDDALVAWVAPGRPVVYQVEGRGFTQLNLPGALAFRMRIPMFARGIQVEARNDAAFVDPQVLWFAGPTLVGFSNIQVPGVGVSVLRNFMVPEQATHFSLFDGGVGAVSTDLPFHFDCLS